MAKIRLQRFLAQAGITSRRKAETLILEGRVNVNSRVVRELGTTVDVKRDVVFCDGRRVFAEDHVWLLLHKPRGTVCTVSDPEGRETVLDLIPDQGVRLYPVGRLDYNTEGALLLTNDGDLASALMHPRNQIPRVYHVKLKGIIDPDSLVQLREGVVLDSGEKVSARVRNLGTTENHTWIEMIITQGLNRQIHRMVECIGGTVLKLTRIAFGDLTIEDLPPARFRALSQREVNELRSTMQLTSETVRLEPVIPGRRSRRGDSRQGQAARTPGGSRARPHAPRAGSAASLTQGRDGRRDEHRDKAPPPRPPRDEHRGKNPLPRPPRDQRSDGRHDKAPPPRPPRDERRGKNPLPRPPRDQRSDGRHDKAPPPRPPRDEHRGKNPLPRPPRDQRSDGRRDKAPPPRPPRDERRGKNPLPRPPRDQRSDGRRDKAPPPRPPRDERLGKNPLPRPPRDQAGGKAPHKKPRREQ